MTVDTVSATGCLGSDSHASEDIGSGSHRFQMIGIHAVTNSAQMVQLKPVGDRAFNKFIGKAVSFYNFMGGEFECAVSVCDVPGSPEPASIRAILIDLVPKAFFHRDTHKAPQNVVYIL